MRLLMRCTLLCGLLCLAQSQRLGGFMGGTSMFGTTADGGSRRLGSFGDKTLKFSDMGKFTDKGLDDAFGPSTRVEVHERRVIEKHNVDIREGEEIEDEFPKIVKENEAAIDSTFGQADWSKIDPPQFEVPEFGKRSRKKERNLTAPRLMSSTDQSEIESSIDPVLDRQPFQRRNRQREPQTVTELSTATDPEQPQDLSVEFSPVFRNLGASSSTTRRNRRRRRGRKGKKRNGGKRINLPAASGGGRRRKTNRRGSKAVTSSQFVVQPTAQPDVKPTTQTVVQPTPSPKIIAISATKQSTTTPQPTTAQGPTSGAPSQPQTTSTQGPTSGAPSQPQTTTTQGRTSGAPSQPQTTTAQGRTSGAPLPQTVPDFGSGRSKIESVFSSQFAAEYLETKPEMVEFFNL